MTLAKYLVLTAAALAVGSAYADTTTTNRASKAEVERKASPAAPKTDEERTHPHSQPDVPHPTETSARKGDAGAGATAPGGADKTSAFKSLDIDGDGLVSKAEAAGHEEVTLAFDRADRNRDGKLSVAEYERYGKAKARADAKAKTKTAARKSDGSASAGGTQPKGKEK
jgi:hypothetical protein